MKNTKAGYSQLIMILVILSVALFMAQQIQTLTLKRKANASDGSKRFIVETTLKSSFAVLEEALSRRMWEMPPDDKCLKSLTFELSKLESPNNLQIKISAEYDPGSKILKMTAENISGLLSPFAGIDIKFEKYQKINDLSNYLIFSKKTESINISTGSLIAKDKLIYLNGPIINYGGRVKYSDIEASHDQTLLINPPYNSAWCDPENLNSCSNASKTFQLPKNESAVVIQADRMYLFGGIANSGWKGFPLPPRKFRPGKNGWEPISSRMHDYMTNKGFIDSNGFMTKFFPFDNTYFFFGGKNQLSMAQTLANDIVIRTSNPSGIQSLSSTIKPFIYPQMLFKKSSSPPYVINDPQNPPIDDGNYPDLEENRSYVYANDHENPNIHAGTSSINFSCYGDPTKPNWWKPCNFSKDFPNGYNRWRENAGLKSTLFTSQDAPEPESPKPGWDNFEALKEDALLCGYEVDKDDLGSEEDCDVGNKQVLKNYYDNPSINPCRRVYKLNESSLIDELNNFNQDDYNNTDPNLLLRRVIYSDVPLEIAQTRDSGFFANLKDNSTGTNLRKSLAFWFVSPDQFLLRPKIPDGTKSPYEEYHDTNGVYQEQRYAYFNKDKSNIKSPVSFVFMSPEQTQLIRPKFDYATYAEIQNQLRISTKDGNRVIKPLYIDQTDFVNNENDFFAWGPLKVEIGNMAMITHTNSKSSSPFQMRGTWDYVYAGQLNTINNACFLSYEDPSNPGIFIPRKSNRPYPPWVKINRCKVTDSTNQNPVNSLDPDNPNNCNNNIMDKSTPQKSKEHNQAYWEDIKISDDQLKAVGIPPRTSKYYIRADLHPFYRDTRPTSSATPHPYLSDPFSPTVIDTATPAIFAIFKHPANNFPAYFHAKTTVDWKGLYFVLEFEDFTYNNKNLNHPKSSLNYISGYNFQDTSTGLLFDISDRKFQFEDSHWFYKTNECILNDPRPMCTSSPSTILPSQDNGASCIINNWYTTYNKPFQGFILGVNWFEGNLSMSAPGDTFKNLGSFSSKELPLLKVKK